MRVIAIVDVDGANTRGLDLSPSMYEYPRVSPDGRHVAVQKDDDIWIHELDRENAIRPFPNQVVNSFPLPVVSRRRSLPSWIQPIFSASFGLIP